MPRVLVVEDEYVIAQNILALLRAKGYETQHAADGLEGFELAKKGKFDLALLDVMLPRVSGLDLCRLLRDEPKTAGIKIVMVTGLGRGKDVDDAFAAGADDYIIKPFDSERFFKKIRKVLGLP